jgi:flavin reductase (DIM6/NTAB) family NADH-FMN oxidoreductase RutF
MTATETLATIDPALFRRVMGRFATGVTVITATANGETRGMTANAFMSGSLHPPLLIVSIAKRAHMHSHIQAAGAFAVNILAAGQEPLATHFAGRPDPELHVEFKPVGGIPTLPSAVARLTAEVAALHDCGDHTLVIGHIQSMESDDRPPLLYHSGKFAALMPIVEEAPGVMAFW